MRNLQTGDMPALIPSLNILFISDFLHRSGIIYRDLKVIYLEIDVENLNAKNGTASTIHLFFFCHMYEAKFIFSF